MTDFQAISNGLYNDLGNDYFRLPKPRYGAAARGELVLDPFATVKHTSHLDTSKSLDAAVNAGAGIRHIEEIVNESVYFLLRAKGCPLEDTPKYASNTLTSGNLLFLGGFPAIGHIDLLDQCLQQNDAEQFAKLSKTFGYRDTAYPLLVPVADAALAALKAGDTALASRYLNAMRTAVTERIRTAHDPRASALFAGIGMGLPKPTTPAPIIPTAEPATPAIPPVEPTAAVPATPAASPEPAAPAEPVPKPAAEPSPAATPAITGNVKISRIVSTQGDPFGPRTVQGTWKTKTGQVIPFTGAVVKNPSTPTGEVLVDGKPDGSWIVLANHPTQGYPPVLVHIRPVDKVISGVGAVTTGHTATVAGQAEPSASSPHAARAQSTSGPAAQPETRQGASGTLYVRGTVLGADGLETEGWVASPHLSRAIGPARQ